jgi:RimJ/RimL family protein N-acetyltransferase
MGDGSGHGLHRPIVADREILPPVIDAAFTMIETERLVLRRFRPDDATAFAAYRSEPAIARYQSWDETYSPADAERMIASLTEAHPGEPGEWFQFAVADRTTDALLGDCALHLDGHDQSRAEIGYTLAPAHQGRGLATEAVAALVAYAFETLGVDRVQATADERNAPSIRVAERLGFEAVARVHTTFKGERCVEETYELRREPAESG